MNKSLLLFATTFIVLATVSLSHAQEDPKKNYGLFFAGATFSHSDLKSLHVRYVSVPGTWKDANGNNITSQQNPGSFNAVKPIIGNMEFIGGRACISVTNIGDGIADLAKLNSFRTKGADPGKAKDNDNAGLYMSFGRRFGKPRNVGIYVGGQWHYGGVRTSPTPVNTVNPALPDYVRRPYCVYDQDYKGSQYGLNIVGAYFYKKGYARLRFNYDWTKAHDQPDYRGISRSFDLFACYKLGERTYLIAGARFTRVNIEEAVINYHNLISYNVSNVPDIYTQPATSYNTVSLSVGIAGRMK
jgi:hypothetical protein